MVHRTMLAVVCLFGFVSLTVSTYEKGIDLTWPYDDKTISRASGQKFEFTKMKAEHKPNGDWYAANEFIVGEHAGTHLDAPYHFDKNGWKVGDIPLSHLRGRGITINLSNETERLGHAAQLLPKHLMEWEKRNGRIPHHSIILLCFDWAKHYHNKTKYLGGETPSDYKYPSISAEAAQWIVDSGKVYGVGSDTPSVDANSLIKRIVHNTLLKNKIYILENVKTPISLPEKGFWLTVMPMLIGQGTGAPTRIVAYPYNPRNDILDELPHLIEWEERNGPIPHNSIILVSFNWAKHYHNTDKYLGGDTKKHYKFPVISSEAAQWIVDTGKVYGLGLDTPSVDPGGLSESVHITLLKNRIYTVENVKILEQLPERGFWLVVMPMNIGEGTGAPTRIVTYPYKPHQFTS